MAFPRPKLQKKVREVTCALIHHDEVMAIQPAVQVAAYAPGQAGIQQRNGFPVDLQPSEVIRERQPTMFRPQDRDLIADRPAHSAGAMPIGQLRPVPPMPQ